MRMNMVNSIKTFNGHHAYAKEIFYVTGMKPLNDNQPSDPFLLGAKDSETYLFALDAASGKIIWKSEKIPRNCCRSRHSQWDLIFVKVN